MLTSITLGPMAFFALVSFQQGQTWDVRSIYQRSLQVSPSTTSALQAVVQAQEHVAEINAQRRMALTFSGSATANRGTEPEPPTDASFQTYAGTVSLPIPNGGRISAQSAQAGAQLNIAQAGLQRARLQLAFQSSDAYLAVLRTRGAEQIAEQTIQQASQQVQDAQKRVQAGDLAPSEVLTTQVSESQAKAALARSKADVRIAEETLNSLVHTDISGIPTLSDLPPIPGLTMDLSQAHQFALLHSPDLLEADANVTLAEGALAEARRGRDPDLTLQATQTHTTDPTTYRNLTTFAINFDLPLADGGVAKHQVNQAVAQLNQAKAARDLAEQALNLAVEQAYLDVQTNEANFQSAKDTLAIAQESYQKAEQAYQAGLTTTRDVIAARTTLAQAKNDANAATYDLALARARLDQVIGQEPQP